MTDYSTGRNHRLFFSWMQIAFLFVYSCYSSIAFVFICQPKATNWMESCKSRSYIHIVQHSSPDASFCAWHVHTKGTGKQHFMVRKIPTCCAFTCLCAVRSPSCWYSTVRILNDCKIENITIRFLNHFDTFYTFFCCLNHLTQYTLPIIQALIFSFKTLKTTCFHVTEFSEDVFSELQVLKQK